MFFELSLLSLYRFWGELAVGQLMNGSVERLVQAVQVYRFWG